MEKLISVKPARWDVTEAYCKKDFGKLSPTPNKLKFLLKLETGEPKRKKLLVSGLNGNSEMVFVFDKDDYYRNNRSLTDELLFAAKIGSSKVVITEFID